MRVVIDCYGHLFEGARRQAAETMDRVFAGTEIGRQPENGRQNIAGRENTKNADPAIACEISEILGGDERIRTADPLHAKQKMGVLSG
jgi:hypothetical protein